MRTTKRRKASSQRLEAHFVSQARPATGLTAAPAIAHAGHWVIRPMNSRTTARVWRLL